MLFAHLLLWWFERKTQVSKSAFPAQILAPGSGKMHEEKGSTRKEVIEAENDPKLYQYEDRKENRSHKHEKKD